MMKHKLPGPVIFLGLVVLGVALYVCIYFYSLSHVGRPPF
jgi:hypothetical protein